MNKLQRIVPVLMVAIAAAGLLQASITVPLSLEKMTDRAERIFVGTCTSTHSYWKERKIWTDVTFQVERHLKGKAVAQVTFRQLGGSVREPAPVAMRVAGMAEFRAGESALLFLERAHDGTETLLGLSQGRVPLVRDQRSGGWRTPNGQPLESLMERIEKRLGTNVGR